MFNPKIAGGPLGMMANRLIQKKLSEWQSQSPEKFKSALSLIQGKSEDQLRDLAENMAKEKNINLKELASLLGLRL